MKVSALVLIAIVSATQPQKVTTDVKVGDVATVFRYVSASTKDFVETKTEDLKKAPGLFGKLVQNIEKAGIDAAVSLTTDKNDLQAQKSKFKEYHYNVQAFKACLRTVNIIDCSIAKSEGDKAIKLTNELVKKKVFSPSSIIDGEADAFRNCHWSASLTRKLGAEKAQKITKLHEKLSKADPNAPNSKMDLHNSDVGVAVGKRAKSAEEVHTLCLRAVQKGKLAVLERNNQ